MGSEGTIPSVEMLKETILEQVSKTKVVSKLPEDKIIQLINVLHSRSFDEDNKKLERALDEVVEGMLDSLEGE